MSVSSEVRKAGPFLGNGTAASFPFGFKVFEADDVKVVQADAGGVETPLTPGVDYSVTLNPEQESAPGGSVVLNTPLPDGERLAITSSMANLQPITLTNQGGFYPEIINAGLDRLTILVQQIAEQIGRAIKVNISSGQDPDELMRELLDGIRQAIDSAALAETKANEAVDSAGQAAQSEASAAGHAGSAAASAAVAAGHADAAAASASNASGSKTAAAGSASAAANSAQQAAESATSASQSAAGAAADAASIHGSVAAAAGHADAAATSASNASKSKTAAASSATAAAESARQAADSAATANVPIDAHEAKPNPHPQYADLANSTGNLDLTGSRKMISTLSSRARVVTDLVQYRGWSSETGAVAFVAPPGDSVMTALEIASFEYGGYTKPKHMHLDVQFYRSSTQAGFHRTSMRSSGAYTPAVRLGVKKGTNKTAVIIGNVDETWGYLHLVVTKALLSHTSLTDAMCTGWTSELVTSLDDFEHVVELNDPLSGPDPHPQYATDTELSALSQSLSDSVQSAISIAQSKVATVNGVGPDAGGNVTINLPSYSKATWVYKTTTASNVKLDVVGNWGHGAYLIYGGSDATRYYVLFTLTKSSLMINPPSGGSFATGNMLNWGGPYEVYKLE